METEWCWRLSWSFYCLAKFFTFTSICFLGKTGAFYSKAFEVLLCLDHFLIYSFLVQKLKFARERKHPLLLLLLLTIFCKKSLLTSLHWGMKSLHLMKNYSKRQTRGMTKLGKSKHSNFFFPTCHGSSFRLPAFCTRTAVDFSHRLAWWALDWQRAKGCSICQSLQTAS